MVADLDHANRTSLHWGQRRAANRLDPTIPVKLARPPELMEDAANVELLLVDAPADSTTAAVRLAEGIGPDIKLTRTQTIMQGASPCDFATGSTTPARASAAPGAKQQGLPVHRL
jgi:hypothetical protein